jgi:predicted transcriptional regulator
MEMRLLDLAIRFLDPRRFRARLRWMVRGMGVMAYIYARAVWIAPRVVQRREALQAEHAAEAQRRLAFREKVARERFGA